MAVLRFLATLCSHPLQMVSISRCASTPRRHTVEVSASQGPQQARPSSYQCPVVGASRRCTCAVGPISRLCIVYWPDFSHPVHPVHPKGSAFQVYQVLLGNTPWRCAHHWALSRRDHLLDMPRHRCVPSMYMCSLSIRSVVLLALTNPRSCWFFLSTVSWR